MCKCSAAAHYQGVTAKRSPIIANRLIEQHDTIKAVYPASRRALNAESRARFIPLAAEDTTRNKFKPAQYLIRQDEELLPGQLDTKAETKETNTSNAGEKLY